MSHVINTLYRKNLSETVIHAGSIFPKPGICTHISFHRLLNNHTVQ
jgi:hypothetical protein